MMREQQHSIQKIMLLYILAACTVLVSACSYVNDNGGHYDGKKYQYSRNGEGDHQEPDFTKTRNTEHPISIRGCAMYYKGKPIYTNQPIDAWIKVLGKPRMLERSGGRFPSNDVYIYIWDHLGLSASVAMNDGDYHQAGSFIDIRMYFYDMPEKKGDMYRTQGYYKDALDIKGLLIGHYPIHLEVLNVFKQDTQVTYKGFSLCTPEDKKKHKNVVTIGLKLYTSGFSNPEMLEMLALSM